MNFLFGNKGPQEAPEVQPKHLSTGPTVRDILLLVQN